MSLPEPVVIHESCGCDHNGREIIHPCDKHAVADQPPPKESEGDVWLLVIDDMKQRRETGIQRYGTPLQPFNGRNALVDAYQEVLDLAVYLRQKIEEERVGPRRAG